MATSVKARRSSKPKLSYGEKMAALRDKLAEFEDEFDIDQRAEMMQRIRGYSDKNIMLILAQNPDAFDVRGHHQWSADDRIVSHGQHGIQILAPAGSKDGEEKADGSGDKTKEKRFFRIVYVFDYSQTEDLAEHLLNGCESCNANIQRGFLKLSKRVKELLADKLNITV